MTFQRGIDGSEPVQPHPASTRPGSYEDWRAARSWRLAGGTLACPRCDAPIGLGGRSVALTQDLSCPFCRHSAAARAFLSLAEPTRPARVAVRMFRRERRRRGGLPA